MSCGLVRELHYEGRVSISHPNGVTAMLHYAVVFLIIALIAAAAGFGGIAGQAAGIAQILFVVFLVLFVLSLILGRRGTSSV